MTILQIAPQYPLPLDHGGRISIFYITKYLSLSGNRMIFLSYGDNIKTELKEELERYCKVITVNKRMNNKPFSILANIFSPVPYNIAKYKTRAFQKAVKKILKEEKIDLVHIDHLHMAWVKDEIKKYVDIPVVLREHNLEQKIMKRFYENTNNLLIKSYAWLQFQKFLRYEQKKCSEMDRCIMITENDEKELLAMNSNIRTNVIEAGVEQKFLGYKKSKTVPYTLFTVGAMDWLPNYEGLKWFVQEILPGLLKRYPEITLHLYGKGTEKFISDPKYDNVIIKHGYVEDIWAETSDKEIALVPLKAGSGIRIKIIEMLAAGQTIVSTRIGAEGINVQNGKNIFLADKLDEYLNAFETIYNDKKVFETIEKEAKELIRRDYTWEVLISKLNEIYKSLTKEN